MTRKLYTIAILLTAAALIAYAAYELTTYGHYHNTIAQ